MHVIMLLDLGVNQAKGIQGEEARGIVRTSEV